MPKQKYASVEERIKARNERRRAKTVSAVRFENSATVVKWNHLKSSLDLKTDAMLADFLMKRLVDTRGR